MPSRPKTIRSLLLISSKKISPGEAEILLAHVLRKPKEYLISHDDAPVSFLNRFRFSRLITKRTQGIPIAYLTGHKEFYGLDFLVNKRTLIPRPETELLVDWANDELRIMNHESRLTTIIDVGTGSGCIPISIKKTIKQKINKTIAIDISRGALKVAKQNAKNHHVDIEFLQGNLLDPVIHNSQFIIHNSSLVITANLPYLTNEQFASEPSIQREPKSALVAEENGLALYRQLLEQISLYALPCTLFLEIDPSQSEPIKKLINNILPQSTIEIKKDLRGQDRVVKINVHLTSSARQ